MFPTCLKGLEALKPCSIDALTSEACGSHGSRGSCVLCELCGRYGTCRTSRDVWGHLGTVLKERDRGKEGNSEAKVGQRGRKKKARTHCVDSERFILG